MIFELVCWIYKVKSGDAFLLTDDPMRVEIKRDAGWIFHPDDQAAGGMRLIKYWKKRDKIIYRYCIPKRSPNIYLPFHFQHNIESKKIRLFERLVPSWLNINEPRKIVWIFFSDDEFDFPTEMLIDLGCIKATPIRSGRMGGVKVRRIEFGKGECLTYYFVSSKLLESRLLPYSSDGWSGMSEDRDRILAIMIDYYQYQYIKKSLLSGISIEI